ncbi:CbtA family protein [Amycolatopsis sp. NPDC098790]|uniref:CbtA family protein n=1 Tax=Amycolatopsis sp. NPDC098790 TaxID=3363939 RepID=UPI00381AAC92
MEKKLVLRGPLAGALGGLLAFVFARIFAEHLIQSAIDYESGRSEAEAALNQAAGLPVESEGPEVFSRAIQANVGIGVGMIIFGVAMGALFAVVYTVSLGRAGRVRPRVLALLVAGAGFLALYLVPFLKYPANPPSIGHPETIGARGGLYLTMVAASILFLAGAVWLGKRLSTRLGTWNATLVAAAAFVVVIGVPMASSQPGPHPLAGAAGSPRVLHRPAMATHHPTGLPDPALQRALHADLRTQRHCLQIVTASARFF